MLTVSMMSWKECSKFRAYIFATLPKEFDSVYMCSIQPFYQSTRQIS